MLEYENQSKEQGYSLVIGVDEAGRGPLAGPVVAAAVALKTHHFDNRIADSKKLTAKQRERAFHEIYDKSYIGVGIMSEGAIDRINILQATFLAMTNAIENLVVQYKNISNDDEDFSDRTCVLIDGNQFPPKMPYKIQTITSGDQLSLSIASASIIAKVTRDRILNMYDKVFPEYEFSRHKGYPTAQHKAAIKKFGPSIIHRLSFNL